MCLWFNEPEYKPTDTKNLIQKVDNAAKVVNLLSSIKCLVRL